SGYFSRSWGDGNGTFSNFLKSPAVFVPSSSEKDGRASEIKGGDADFSFDETIILSKVQNRSVYAYANESMPFQMSIFRESQKKGNRDILLDEDDQIVEEMLLNQRLQPAL